MSGSTVSSGRDELNHSTLPTLAATVGAVPVALAVGLALTLALPLSANLRLTIGLYAVFPVWVATACFTFLAPSARRAWLLLLATLALAGMASLLAIGLGQATPATWGG